jgi:serine/threonine protein kinase
MKTVTHSLKILHELKIVHGDLKPDNILIKKTSTGGYTTKLIDFDNSYFSGKPPLNPEEVVGTPEYYSPELANYIKSVESIGNRKSLTVQSDIFALGVIFCEYLTGSKPNFSKKYNYAWEDVADGNSLTFKDGLRTKKLDSLIKSMLVLSYDKRPSISEVFDILRSPDILKDEIAKATILESTSPSPGLRISTNLKRAISNSEEIIPDESSEKLRGKGLKSGK